MADPCAGECARAEVALAAELELEASATSFSSTEKAYPHTADSCRGAAECECCSAASPVTSASSLPRAASNRSWPSGSGDAMVLSGISGVAAQLSCASKINSLPAPLLLVLLLLRNEALDTDMRCVSKVTTGARGDPNGFPTAG